MHDAGVALQPAGDAEHACRLGQPLEVLEHVAPYDQIGKAGLVLEREEGDALGRARALAADDQPDVVHAATFGPVGQLGGGRQAQLAQSTALVLERVAAGRVVGAPPIPQHRLGVRQRREQGQRLVLHQIQLLVGPLRGRTHLPERLASVQPEPGEGIGLGQRVERLAVESGAAHEVGQIAKRWRCTLEALAVRGEQDLAKVEAPVRAILDDVKTNGDRALRDLVERFEQRTITNVVWDRAAIVEPPPELINKILFEVTSGPSRVVVKAPLSQRLFGKWLQPVLQPRFAMGMAMTMLSLGMLLRMSGVRQWTDLNPVNVYAAAEDHVTRLWDRGVKNYQSLKLVYEIQTRYQEWAAEQDRARERDRANGDKGGEKQ